VKKDIRDKQERIDRLLQGGGANTYDVVNPSNLRIISGSVVSFEPQEGSRDAILTVKLDGSGFNDSLDVSIIRSEGRPVEPRVVVASAGQMFLKITQPEAIVHIMSGIVRTTGSSALSLSGLNHHQKKKSKCSPHWLVPGEARVRLPFLIFNDISHNFP
jgi:hypothetical protein